MSARDAGFDVLLAQLGYQPDDVVSLCHKPVGGEFSTVWCTVDKAPEVADDHADDSDVWFGEQKQSHKAGSGRGKATDITRMTGLYGDLDIKAGGLPTDADAEPLMSGRCGEFCCSEAGGIVASVSPRLVVYGASQTSVDLVAFGVVVAFSGLRVGLLEAVAFGVVATFSGLRVGPTWGTLVAFGVLWLHGCLVLVGHGVLSAGPGARSWYDNATRLDACL
jgi:hypothetical protein